MPSFEHALTINTFIMPEYDCANYRRAFAQEISYNNGFSIENIMCPEGVSGTPSQPDPAPDFGVDAQLYPLAIHYTENPQWGYRFDMTKADPGKIYRVVYEANDARGSNFITKQEN